MPSFGCYSPFPLRFGGATPPLKHRVDSILAQLGTAYTKDTTGLVWLRAMAMGRAFWDVWETSQRLANQNNPPKMTDFLGRWEKILALPVSPSDSLATRRARVGVARARSGYATGGTIYATCLAYLGSSIFISIAVTSSGSANVWTPSGWPMGSHPSGPSDPDWFSGVSHIDVLTMQPAAMDDATWRATAFSVVPALDAILPSWVTFDIIKDGPSGNGFFLDDPHNLDFERFST